MGSRAEVVVGDVTHPAVRAVAPDWCSRKTWRPGYCCEQRRSGSDGPLCRFVARRLREVFELNFFAAAELIRESLPLLEVSHENACRSWSTSARSSATVATPRNSEYCASKFALRGLTRRGM